MARHIRLMNEKIAQHRRELLREMSLIERMEYGSLAEECREVRARLESGEKLAMDFLERALRAPQGWGASA